MKKSDFESPQPGASRAKAQMGIRPAGFVEHKIGSAPSVAQGCANFLNLLTLHHQRAELKSHSAKMPSGQWPVNVRP